MAGLRPSFSERVLVVDNGAYTCKVGWAGDKDPKIVAPNATGVLKSQLEPYVADQIESSIKNHANLTLTRPCERGIITNWPCQIDVWQRLFPLAMQPTSPGDASSSGGKILSQGVAPKECALSASVAPCTPTSVVRCMDEVVFEELHFGGFVRYPSPCGPSWRLAQLRQGGTGGVDVDRGSACVVVDLGFSATNVTPCIMGVPVPRATKRLNIGGKLLTNLLKEVVSYRQYNMMDEFRLINGAKEALSYIAPYGGIAQEMKATCGGRKRRIPSGIAAYREWVLPDYATTFDGYSRTLPIDESTGCFKRTRPGDPSMEPALRLESERFTVPEVLFFPSDIGLKQASLPEVIAEAVGSCDLLIQAPLYANVILTGGTACLPGLKDRLYRELRPLVPSHMDLKMSVASDGEDDPVLMGWRGASDWSSSSPDFAKVLVSREDFNEGGSDYCSNRFNKFGLSPTVGY